LAAAGKARDRTTRAMDLFVAFWPHEETRGERRTGNVMTTPACALTHHLDRRFRQEALMSRAASASAFTAALSARRTQAATENKKMSGTRERKTVEPNSALVVASRGSTQDGQASALLDQLTTAKATAKSTEGELEKRFTGTP
jgi:predicted amidophosphoribosyltransferase